MGKCEWKDGVYKPCEKMAKQIIDDVTEKGSFILSDYTECGCGGNLKPEEKYCNSECGMRMKYGVSCDKHNCLYLKTEIEPEEKPLIVKSGETWVKYENDENYLCVNPYNYNNGFKDPDNWKLFSEIELTDHIAKLRPVVISNEGNQSKLILYGIFDYICIFLGGQEFCDNVHLATPHELQESE